MSLVERLDINRFDIKMLGYHVKCSRVADERSLPFPVQTFMSKTLKFEKDMAKRRAGSDQKTYCHLSYYVNLSNPAHPMDKYFWEIDRSVKLGLNGCVVHVGKALKLPKDEALSLMADNINILLEHCTIQCPLMLETPAGQGTELVRDFEGFSSFCNQFIHDQRFAVCIDTCHVFAAGHCPLDYVDRWLNESCIRLGLIHMNDSKCPKGSCKDRHERVGQGYIGFEVLSQVIELSESIGIDMIRE